MPNEKRIITISVRRLAELLCRQGDLTPAAAYSMRAQEGTRIHAQEQDTRSPDYQREIPVRYMHPGHTVDLLLTGRIDLLGFEQDRYVVEEIKSTYAPRQRVGEGYDVHWVQAKCYAAIYLLHNRLDEIAVRLLYVLLPSQQKLPIEQVYPARALLQWFYALCDSYIEVCQCEEARMAVARESIQALAFPFAQERPAQRAMAEAVLDASRQGEPLLISAPTGSGKTMGTVYPALQAYAQGWCEKIFYLTSKNTQHSAAESALRRLYAGGLRCRSLTVAAKDKLCPVRRTGICRPENCPYATGFYDRLDALLPMLPLHGHLSARDIEQLGLQHSLCPHELALCIAERSDIIICDYNHAFDPVAHMRRFFDLGGEYLLLVDEAHNLVDRARDMFSAALSLADVQAAAACLPLPAGATELELQTHEHLLALTRAMLALAAQTPGEQCLDAEPDPLAQAANDALATLQELIRASSDAPPEPPLLDFYFNLRTYCAVLERMSAQYALIHTARDGQFTSSLRCIDPAPRLQESIARVNTAVFFSATLTPFAYYKRLYGLPDAATVKLPNPFPPENLKVFVRALDTTYARREQTARQAALSIGAMAQAQAGNYLVFLPSHAYMRAVHEQFSRLYPQVHAPLQKSAMSHAQRADYLELFVDDSQTTMVAFAVMGGIFAEGIDLAGRRLIGVAVVGVGRPPRSLERDLIRAYHDEQDEDGDAFAYVVPGMNKVLQAAGRLIRTQHDQGIVMLMDNRFMQSRYQQLMPPNWQSDQWVGSADAVRQICRRFWDGL